MIIVKVIERANRNGGNASPSYGLSAHATVHISIVSLGDVGQEWNC